MCDLDAHVAQAANPHDSHLMSRAHIPVAQRRVRGDARAEQGSYRSELLLGMAHTKHIALMHDDLL